MKEQAGINEYDVREDDEQNAKFQEIIDLLVAAGYFRARIKGLSAFDKVIGGIIWSMDCCNVDVNVDLLFQENSTIGQKISITEKIVTVLPKMECPFRIEPHQIQGLDFVHIFPLIQWLIKRSVKVREEKKEFIRNHAVLKFENQINSSKTNMSKLIENIQKIQENFGKKRLFKRKNNCPKTEELQVESTLLEFGVPYNPLTTEVQSSFKSFSKMANFNEVHSAKIVGTIVNSQFQKIAQVSQEFAKLKEDIEGPNGILIRKRKDMLMEKKKQLFNEQNNLKKEIEVNSLKSKDIKQDLSKFKSTHQNKNDTQFRMYEKLESLILMQEDLKKQEQIFRSYCKKELEVLNGLINVSGNKNQSQENSLAERSCEEEKEKVQALRLLIAKKNRSIAFLQRQLDEIPGRGELAQYQRRFLELYSEVAQKHEETKQFYTMYNTLDDTKLYLSKELSLLNSVLDNYSDAMSNSIDKEEFMRQFESIVAAIKQNKQKVEKRRFEERNRRDKLSKQLLDLVEQQRNYVNIVKQLRIECKKNEELLARFKSK